jgi:aminoglycoside phosphotransferase (APT) family kinase protein
VADRPEVAPGLAAWLADRGHPAEVEVLERAVGGLSQETWIVRIHLEDRDLDVVLRLPTPASGDRAILTQRAALQAASGSDARAPELLWFDDTGGNPFGRPFIVMHRVPGDVPVGWHELDELRRCGLAEQAIDALAALHGVDVGETPFGGGRTHPLMTLDGLAGLFERLDPVPVEVRAGIWWLRRHVPAEPTRRVIVHGDFRMGNMVVDGDRLAGVLDWEMASPGDPLVDLAWCFIPVWQPSGLDEEPLVLRYAEQTGSPVDPERLGWHRCLGFLRLAYYALAGTRAFDAGRSDDFRVGALRLQLPVHLDRLAASISGEAVD